MTVTTRWTLPLPEVGLKDLALVGGKNASLGELLSELAGQGVRVPGGFAITAPAYFEHLRRNGLNEKIEPLLKGLDVKNLADLAVRARTIRELILSSPLPPEIESEILAAYARLSQDDPAASVAVRSSATAEDLPEASFAGQQETSLNVRGEKALIDSVRRCFASLFTDRAIAYRANLAIAPFSVGLSVGVQKMVRSDLACSGVMFSLDTETGFRDVVLINASYGLGEAIVQGAVNPDEFMIFKPTLNAGFRPIIKKVLGSKEFKVVYDSGGEKGVRTVPVPPKERARPSLSEDDALQLARWAVSIEAHYSEKYGRPTPMDMEWAKDGQSGLLYIVQARPETVEARKSPLHLETYRLKGRAPVLARGQAVGAKIGAGKIRVIRELKDLETLEKGEILVTDKTDPDWEPVLQRAAAIVTNQGGRTCHAAIVSRELGIPAVVGTENGTESLTTGRDATVSCAEGETGNVYDGKIAFEVEQVDLAELPPISTKLMMNIANPGEALKLSRLPNDGVGLAREEFIVADSVRVHPMALVHFDRLEPGPERDRIAALTRGYEDRGRYFVDRLAEGAAMIAAAFYPKDVIFRFSDFKTNEYAHLPGGRLFEPVEENPMLGFRGASRYYDERYREGFALECRAVLKVREEMGLTNLKVMVPFCRTVEEGRRVLEEMKRNGLGRGTNGLEVYVMCEIPSNVLLADRFADLFDGFSIGSNDLTQLVLGVDRDSKLVAGLFKESDPAVLKMISLAIRSAKAKGRKIGLCGQAPSDDPEFAAFLLREGIDSISLNPDALLKTRLRLAAIEKEKQRAAPASSPPSPSARGL